MISFLHKQISFNSRFKNQLAIALILGGILALIMIFLGPFDTDRFQSNYKNLILGGFGVLFSIFYVINARLESWWYTANHKKWTIKNEVIAFLTLMLISSIPIHFYNQVFLNEFFNQDYRTNQYLQHGLWFIRTSIIPIMLILLPFYIYFRSRFGELISPRSLNEIELSGINKGEKLLIQNEELLFVKSSENYVEIFYEKGSQVKHETFRNTLSEINRQAAFLKRCHRSYLVNISNIKRVKGNSQNAKIEFHQHGLDIPLSNTYYKSIKSSLAIHPKI
ncbi:LytTR family DNA-binding domain-containing protein [Poritiphilus flavus]|uniref:HTH LytTR-type domain-containing protein n=1 Tax=Poritiphilus flavus TaxID=2697053 RepID=A0A6L9EES4_9FLAO|nr:LytTR family DNA-binding domain-containing protein [Poritiphilus flavus]NAS13008.1 hypothetical protein [Poritiphilus flavus]